MKGFLVEQWLNGPEDLVLKNNVPVPVPRKGQVLVQVKAAGLNFFDTLMIQGRYQIKPPFPFIPGAEFAGVVVQSTVPQFAPGDRVFGSGSAFAQMITASAADMLPMPDAMSFEEAAGIYITYPTSYAGLVLRGQLKAGEYCLVHAAAGGVGIAAVQIAKALGAIVVATAGSAEKLQVVKGYGADYCINYNDKDWVEQVKKVTQGRGADVVYDPVGLVEESSKCTAFNGRIVIVGFTGGAIEKVAMNRLLLKNIAAVGLHWGAYAKYQPEMVAEVWEALFRLFAEKKISSALYEKVYSLETIPQAMKAIQGRTTHAKVVATLHNENKL